MRLAIASGFAVLQLMVGLVFADPDNDLSRIDRTIRKEPKYTCDRPLYCLAVFGPAMKTRVWLVLDKSAPAQTHYDVAYIDLNANGDLTDATERITPTGEQPGESRFTLPTFNDPATGDTHTEFTVRCKSQGEVTQMVGIKWKGNLKFGGGYPQDPAKEKYLRFAESPKDAPVLWLNGDGPLTFQYWCPEKLKIGGDTDVKLFIGVPGVGPSSFCAFQVHALPEGEGVEGVLHYQTDAGEQRSVAFALLEKC